MADLKPYQGGYDPTLNAVAEQLQKNNKLSLKAVRKGNKTPKADAPLQFAQLFAKGECPRCGDQFHELIPQSITTTLRAGKVGDMVTCACDVVHPSTPPGESGCGASFVMNLDTTSHYVPRDDDDFVAANEEDFQSLTADADKAVLTSATQWSAGLTALLAVVVAGIWIKGPDSASKLDHGTLLVIVVLAIVALAAHMVALGLLLFITAGTPRRFAKKEMIRDWGSVNDFREHRRDVKARQLRVAKWIGLAALAPMLVALVFWVTAPEGPFLKVKAGDDSYCGVVSSSDSGTLVITRQDTRTDAYIPLSKVTDIGPVSSCDG